MRLQVRLSLPPPGTPPQGRAEVGLAHLPDSSPLLFQVWTGTGEPRLAEMGKLGTSSSKVTGTAHIIIALGHAGGGRCLPGPRPGPWRLAGHREDV